MQALISSSLTMPNIALTLWCSYMQDYMLEVLTLRLETGCLAIQSGTGNALQEKLTKGPTSMGSVHQQADLPYFKQIALSGERESFFWCAFQSTIEQSQLCCKSLLYKTWTAACHDAELQRGQS